MNTLVCPKCGNNFDNINKVPLVLKCGDTLCMPCLISECYLGTVMAQCPRCKDSQELNFSIIKDLPKNKAILDLLSRTTYTGPLTPPAPREVSPGPNYAFTPGPSAKLLGFDESPNSKPLATPFRLSSPHSVDVKCKRPGCNNDRYYLNGSVYEYCSINCYNMDHPNLF